MSVSPFIFCPNLTLSLSLFTKDEIISMVTDAYCQACPYVAELCPLDFLALRSCRRVLEDVEGSPSRDSSPAQGNV